MIQIITLIFVDSIERLCLPKPHARWMGGILLEAKTPKDHIRLRPFVGFLAFNDGGNVTR